MSISIREIMHDFVELLDACHDADRMLLLSNHDKKWFQDNPDEKEHPLDRICHASRKLEEVYDQQDYED